MANLNQLVCANQVANTGFSSCFLDLSQIVGAFIVPNGYSLTAAKLLDIQASLALDAKAASKLNRVYPIGDFVSVNSATEAKTVQTFSYGGKKVVREGDYDWTFEFTEGGMCLHKALRAFNSNGGWSVIFFDSSFKLFGTTGVVEGSLYAIPTKVMWANPWTPNDGSKSTMYSFQVVFEPRFINQDLAYAVAGSYLTDINGLQDVKITKNTWVENTGVVNVSAVTACGTNLLDVYPTELAVIGAWKANNKVTGAVITIASVAAVPATKSFNVTLDTADPDFPAGVQGILFDLGSITALEAASVIGYESAGSITLPTTV